MRKRGSVLTLTLLFSGLLGAQAVSPAERQRFEEIKARHDRGEAVSADDRQFAQSVTERMQQTAAAEKNADYARAHPARESTGLVALPDLGETQYHGESGGLYPGGKNIPPGPHMAAGLAFGRSIAPLDAEGRRVGGRAYRIPHHRDVEHHAGDAGISEDWRPRTQA